MSNAQRCWFCDGVAVEQETLIVGLQRDVENTHLLIVVFSKWRQTYVAVPRCQKCRSGHSLSRTLMPGVPGAVLAVAVIVGALYEAGWVSWPPAHSSARDIFVMVSVIISATLIGLALLGWAIVRFGWLGARQRFGLPLRHLREYPAVKELLADGWHYNKPHFFG